MAGNADDTLTMIRTPRRLSRVRALVTILAKYAVYQVASDLYCLCRVYKERRWDGGFENFWGENTALDVMNSVDMLRQARVMGVRMP